MSADILQQESIDLEAYYTLCFGYYQACQYDKAARFFSSLTLLAPQDLRAWKGLAASLQMQDNFQQAAQTWAIASLLDPQDPLIYFHAAECLKSIDDCAGALQALAQAKDCVKHHEKDGLKEKIEILEAAVGNS